MYFLGKKNSPADNDLPIFRYAALSIKLDVRGLGEKGRVLTVFATAAYLYIHLEGELLVDDGAKTPEILLTKLLHERGRFAFYHDLGLRNIIKKRKLENKIRILPTSFSSYSHYAAFKKKTPIEAVNTVRAALVKLKTNGALGKILRKYDLVE